MIVFDESLNIPPGKVASQSVHASLGAVRDCRNTKWLRTWRESGEAVVVLKEVGSEQLIDLHKAAKAIGVPAYTVNDAGRTCVKPGALTCIGIGPAPAWMVDRITSGLHLY